MSLDLNEGFRSHFSMSSEPNSPSHDAIKALRDALQFSPQNIPLRQHLGDTLLSMGLPEEAEKEFREALAIAPKNQSLMLGLARAFSQQNKDNHALALLETLTKTSDAHPKAFLLHAKLLFKTGEVEQSVFQYRRAVELDTSLKDAEFAERLGIGADSDEDEIVEGKVRSAWEPESAAPRKEIERPKIAFKDVGGMGAVKEEIRMKIIHPLTHADLYKSYGKSIGGGILLFGPPGCGKTYLARATAGEIKSNFLAIGINDILEMWIGSSERNLHAVFENAREHKPCVLFFDEVDALGASRSDMKQHAGRQLINQFLSEMDGVNTSNDGVLILAATNAPWHLDSAFRRPGRFDRILFVPPPDAAARASILRLLCHGKPVEDIDYDHVAKKTVDFSGADLKAVVDVAVENKLREAMKAGIPKPLTTKDLVAAAATLKPTTKEWFASARNYALYSNQGGIYDDILQYLKL
jgi:ATP-dependent 26S proteasome regulatory subunit